MQNIEIELKDILDDYAISVRDSMQSGRYKEKQELAIKEILKLIKGLK